MGGAFCIRVGRPGQRDMLMLIAGAGLSYEEAARPDRATAAAANVMMAFMG